ncbi:MAG: cytochrome c3 family protein [Deltaproteobacteria bacterium]|nr:cytochrome c3 family protein [Deltaproteobacteria bacterium]
MAQIFPRWTNKIPFMVGVTAPVALCGVVFVVWYYFSPKFTDVGYMPSQPVPYSHKLHVSQLGIDCRYCHSTVEEASFASIPPNGTCMNCHANLDLGERQRRVQPVIDSYEGKSTLEWVKVHMLPDYAYFAHAPHINAGVGCESCHGRVDQMEIVYQDQPLSMSWCLDCHRDPTPHLRPRDQVTTMGWLGSPEAAAYDPDKDPTRTRKLVKNLVELPQVPADALNPPIANCSGCHR